MVENVMCETAGREGKGRKVGCEAARKSAEM